MSSTNHLLERRGSEPLPLAPRAVLARPGKCGRLTVVPRVVLPPNLSAIHRVGPGARRCAYGRVLGPPNEGEDWWLPTASDKPDKSVRIVADYGEDPVFLCFVRVGELWQMSGISIASVGWTRELTWEGLGSCRCGISHIIVPVAVAVPPAECT